MDAELKAKWVKALRSGELEQATGTLLDKHGRMCCIGVLGRVCGIADDVLLDNPYVGGDYDGRSLHLIEAALPRQDHRHALARMNDHGKTFPEIADCIEREL